MPLHPYRPREGGVSSSWPLHADDRPAQPRGLAACGATPRGLIAGRRAACPSSFWGAPGARTPARGPLSPVAPRRTAVAAAVRPADLSLPCKALHLSGVSYEDGLLSFRDEVKRLGDHQSRSVAAGPRDEGDRSDRLVAAIAAVAAAQIDTELRETRAGWGSSSAHRRRLDPSQALSCRDASRRSHSFDSGASSIDRSRRRTPCGRAA